MLRRRVDFCAKPVLTFAQIKHYLLLHQQLPQGIRHLAFAPYEEAIHIAEPITMPVSTINVIGSRNPARLKAAA